MAITVFFKLTIAPPSELVSNRQIGELAAKFFDPDRHLTAAGSFAGTLWSFGDWAVNPVIPLLIFLVVHGLNRPAVRSSDLLTCPPKSGNLKFRLAGGCQQLAIVVAGYLAVYVTTPFDLSWHLDTSAPRVFLQLWPPALVLAGLLAGEVSS